MFSALTKQSFLCAFACIVAAGPVLASPARDADAGIAAFGAGDVDTAIRLLTRAIHSGGLAPDQLAVTLHHRGLAHQRTGEIARAILDYTAALHEDAFPLALVPRALNNRALCFEVVGDLPAALRDLNRALTLMANYPDAYANRGSVLRKMQAADLALRDFQSALDMGFSRPAQVLLGMGEAYAMAGEKERAVQALQKAQSLEPRSATIRERLASLTGTALAAQPGTARGQLRPDPSATRRADGPQGPLPSYLAEVHAGPAAPPALFAAAQVPPVLYEDGLPLRAAPVRAYQVSSVGAVPALGASAVEPVEVAPGLSFRIGGANLMVQTGEMSERVARPALVRHASLGDLGVMAAAPSAESLFGLQLGSYATEAQAQAGEMFIRDQYAGVLSSLSLRIEAADVPRRGRVYRVIAHGLPTREAAALACRALVRRGQACVAVPLAGGRQAALRGR